MNRLPFVSLFQSPFGRALAGVLLAFTVIPVLALLALSGITLRNQLENRSLAQMQTVADLDQNAVEQWLASAQADLTAALESPVIAQNATFALQSPDLIDTESRSAQVLLEQMTVLTDDPYFHTVYLTRPDSEIVLSTQRAFATDRLGINLAIAQAQGRSVWGIVPSRLHGQLTAYAWQPLTDRRQVVVGFLVGELNLTHLNDLLDEASIGSGQTTATYLVDTNRQTVLGNPLPASTEPVEAVIWSAPALVEAAAADTVFNGTFRTPDGTPVIGTLRPLATELEGWLIVTQDEAEAFQLLYDAAPLALVYTLVLTGLAIFAALLVTQRITNPLRVLQRAAQAMTGGQLQTRVDIRRADEFGSLADSFNAMADRLQQAFSTLEHSNTQLADRAEQLATITRVGQLATEFLEMNQLLETVAAEIQRAFAYKTVILYLPDADAQHLVPRAAAGKVADNWRDHLIWALDATNAVGAAAVERRTIVNVADDTTGLLLPPGTRSEANIPLLVGSNNTLIGILNIQSVRADAFASTDLDVLQIFASQLAIAIRNADLFTESEQARESADIANQQKSDFLSNMSHELRTPLNVIIGYSHSMLNRPAMYQHVELPPVYAEALDNILTSGHHLLGLINDILDLSKIEAGKIDLDIQPIDPLPILQGVRSTALGLVRDGVQVYTDYSPTLPPILGDELRVRQVLLNLVSNAAKFTDHGSITLAAQADADELIFRVTDTGSGIAEDLQPLLFTRYEQGVPARVRQQPGTGLGLSISRELTRLHGGKIWFESTPGQGSTFYFTIPLAPTTVTPLPHLPQDEMADSARVFVFTGNEQTPVMQQILLLDTQSNTRNELYTALAEHGWDVLAIHDVNDVSVMANALLPDVIVLHAHAGQGMVRALADDIRAEAALAAIPVVVLSDTGLTGTAADDAEQLNTIFTQISEALMPTQTIEPYNQK